MTLSQRLSSRATRGTCFFCFLLFILALTALPASAQVKTGTPPFGSFGGGPDIINLANLNSHIVVPALHKAGRGTNFTYDLSYDTSVWFPVTSGSTTTWQPVNNFGWRGQSEAALGYISYSTHRVQCPAPSHSFDIVYDTYAYHDTFGITHSFSGSAEYDCSGSFIGFTSASSDGSGYTLTVTDFNISTVISAAGKVTVPPVNSTAGASTSTDRNGNQTTVDGSGHFYDTLSSTTPVLTVAGSGTPTSPTTFTYTAPSGASASYTMKYTTYTVQTAFGCTGITEYGATSTSLVSEIDLPDSTKYTFTYETTPNDTHSPHYVTGRLASVTLPTGGTISYTYTGGSNGISCADGSVATLTRTTPDGTWTYAQVKGTGAASTTTITDPQSNNTVVQFQGIYETQRQVYQGAVAPASLLKTVNICYNGNTTNCITTAVTPPITQRNITDILPGTSNLQCQHVYKYNSSGSLTEQDDYDYGSGATGALLKKTAITFASLGNITKFRQTVTITDGTGATISKTNYNYDETAVVATSGTPQQTSVSGSRGNLTSINYYTQGTTFLTKRMTYFDTGKVQTVTDLNGAQTTYTYGACGNSFPTSVSEPLSLSRSMTWNCTGGAQLTVTDENNQTTTTGYSDPSFWRPASLTDPTNAAANFTYTGQTQTEAALSFNSGASAADPLVTRDGLGRPHVSQVREAPGSANFDSTETDYDALGRVSRVTLPYVGTVGQTNPSAPAQTTTYDALSRTLSASDSGGGSITHSYSQNDEIVTRSPAPSGENTKRRQYQYDGLGRLASVCELTSATGSGSCAQTNAQTGYWTKYSYNALGHLTGVTQNAQSTGSTQSRTYVYDLMGRLTSETNPENQTTTYTYDSDSTCGTSSGDLVKRVDAVGNVTCTSYDALHRPLSVTYPSGSYAAKTPSKYFVYDSATVNSVAMTNVKGRLAEAYTCNSPCTSKLTDEGFSYTVRGDPADIYEKTPNSSSYYHASEQYWANGALKQLSGLTGLPTITFVPDSEGRPYQATASSGQNPVTSTLFNAASLPTSVTYGSTDTDSYTYDSNTNRLTQYKFTVNAQSFIGALTWNANHSLQSLQITDPFNSADNQTCAFGYDDLKRLQSANCGTVWGQTFSYDPFGNITKSVISGSQGNSFQPTYSTSTNKMTSLPGFTPTYDANGNVTNDSNHTYSWDSVGKPVSIDSVSITYDALGRAVEQNRSGTYTQIVYGPNGGKLALFNGQTLQKAFVPLPGGGQATYNSTGLLYYGHPDHLGSIRLGSTPSRTMYFAMAYAPFGETYVQSGTTDPAFTGQRQDTASGLYDFPAREYSNQGRWPSPDPSGLSSVHLFDPQTLNRYAYVRNSPLALIDSTGMDSVPCEAKIHTKPAESEVAALGPSSYELEMDSLEFPPDDGSCVAGGDAGAPATGGDLGGSVDSGNSGDSGHGIDNSNNGDPTSGGDPNNSGSGCPANAPSCGGPAGNDLPWNTELINPNGSSFFLTDPSSYTAEVSASLSDQPVVQTQDVPNGSTLEDPQVGMPIFTNNPQCPNCGTLWNSASDTVTAGAAFETALVAIVAAAPAVAGAADVVNEVIITTFAEDPRAWQGTLDVLQGLLQPTSQPSTPEGGAIRIIMQMLKH